MAATYCSRLLPRDRQEWRWAIGCIVLSGLETAMMIGLLISSQRFDLAFLARRAALRERLAMAHPIAWRQDVRTGSGTNVPGLVLTKGWSTPEPDGVWTDARSADLTLVVPESRAAMLTLSGSAMLPPTGRQTIELHAGGRKIATWLVDHTAVRRDAILPKDVFSASGMVRIQLVIGSPRRFSTDPRLLGLKLSSLSVSPLPRGGPSGAVPR